MPIGRSNEKQQLSVFNTTTGQSKSIGNPETYADVVASPTGRYIAAAVQAQTRGGISSVLLYDTLSGTQATYTQPSGMDTSFLEWSPNGK
jgi:Tol biopolymer transport system component